MRYAQIKKEISPNPFKDTNIYYLSAEELQMHLIY